MAGKESIKPINLHNLDGDFPNFTAETTDMGVRLTSAISGRVWAVDIALVAGEEIIAVTEEVPGSPSEA